MHHQPLLLVGLTALAVVAPVPAQAAPAQSASVAEARPASAKLRTKVHGWGSTTAALHNLKVSGPAHRLVKVQTRQAGRWLTFRRLHTSRTHHVDAAFVGTRPGRWRLHIPARGSWRARTTSTMSGTPRAATAAGATVNVVAMGASGNGRTDDTAAVQSAMTAAGRIGGTVVVPAGTFRVTRVVSVPENVTVSGVGTIRQVTAGVSGLRVTGSGVTIEGITLTGRNASVAYAGGEYGIEAQGTSGSPLSGLTVRNVTLSKWGAYGMFLRQVSGFKVTGCVLSDIGYTGIGVLTGTQGEISGNTVDNITPGTSGNAYGIVMSFAGTEAESTDIVVRGNTVSRVFWEAIDAHAGSRLTIDNNTVRNSGDGIALAQGSTASQPGSNNMVTNNLVEDSSKRGIVVVGQSGTPRAAVTVSGNTVRRSGSGLLAFYTKRLVVSNNSFTRSQAIGVYLDHHNADFQVTGNTFTDMWSNSAWTAGIHTAASGNTNTGTISGNTLARGSKQATYLNDYGYYYRGGRTGITVGTNNFATATSNPVAGEK